MLVTHDLYDEQVPTVLKQIPSPSVVTLHQHDVPSQVNSVSEAEQAACGAAQFGMVVKFVGTSNLCGVPRGDLFRVECSLCLRGVFNEM